MVIDSATGVIKTLDQLNVTNEPWQVQNSVNPATSNTQNIYQQGNVAIGLNLTSDTPTTTKKLEVLGTYRIGNLLTDTGTNDIYYAGLQNGANGLYSYIFPQQHEAFLDIMEPVANENTNYGFTSVQAFMLSNPTQKFFYEKSSLYSKEFYVNSGNLAMGGLRISDMESYVGNAKLVVIPPPVHVRNASSLNLTENTKLVEANFRSNIDNTPYTIADPNDANSTITVAPPTFAAITATDENSNKANVVVRPEFGTIISGVHFGNPYNYALPPDNGQFGQMLISLKRGDDQTAGSNGSEHTSVSPVQTVWADLRDVMDGHNLPTNCLRNVAQVLMPTSAAVMPNGIIHTFDTQTSTFTVELRDYYDKVFNNVELNGGQYVMSSNYQHDRGFDIAYAVRYFDKNLIEEIQVNDNGLLTYKLKATATPTGPTYMNLSFSIIDCGVPNRSGGGGGNTTPPVPPQN